MPCSVAVFDMENHDNLPLTQEPLPVLPPCDVSITAAACMNRHVDDDTSATTAGFSLFLNDPSTFASEPLSMMTSLRHNILLAKLSTRVRVLEQQRICSLCLLKHIQASRQIFI